jgi:hypothetical protein
MTLWLTLLSSDSKKQPSCGLGSISVSTCGGALQIATFESTGLIAQHSGTGCESLVAFVPCVLDDAAGINGGFFLLLESSQPWVLLWWFFQSQIEPSSGRELGLGWLASRGMR